MVRIDFVILIVGYFNFSEFRNSFEEKEKGIVELVDVGGGSGVVLQIIFKMYFDFDFGSCVL